MKLPVVAVLQVGVEGDRAIEFQADDSDFVQPKSRHLLLLQGIDIHRVLHGSDPSGGNGRGGLDQVDLPRLERFVVHPDQVRLRMPGMDRRGIREPSACLPG